MTDDSLRRAITNSYEAHSHDDEYERALGRFMIAWADTELEMYRVLKTYAGVSDPVGRALFSGTRMKGMTDYIKAIDHNAPLLVDRSSDLAHIFPQISAINTMRDHLAHHSTSSYSFKDETTRVVANARASRYGKNVGYEISIETIDSMTHDLHGIFNHLNMHHGPRTGAFQAWREDPADAAPTKWTYKAPQPIPKWETAPPGTEESPLQKSSAWNN